MAFEITRRRALFGLSGAAFLAQMKVRTAFADDSEVTPFAQGIASGDPDPTSVVLWTRIAPTLNATTVDWEIASDAEFDHITGGGTVTTDADRDFTIKLVAAGLQPGKTYYYRFTVNGITSPTGRTRTLPVGRLDRLGLALASCSNYPFGHFNAYDAIAKDEQIDYVVHLGDYIYEYGPAGYGGQIGAEIGRPHAPDREIVSLDDYRERHAQYKSDPGSRAMHAAHPLIAIWDDHESANNPWMEGAQNHQSNAEGDWGERRAASLKAYYEWMPVRDPQAGGSREEYWRHYEFADLASLITLETRHTGRSRQIDYNDHLLDLETTEDARRFRQEVLGATQRRMLSRDNVRFVETALRESLAAGRPWRLIGNQVPLARIDVPRLDEPLFNDPNRDPDDAVSRALARLTRLGELALPIYIDCWDGYPAARERFYRSCTAAGATDLLVLTGDTHAFWANSLFTDAGAAMGVEIGTAGVTSPGDFEGGGAEISSRMDILLAQHNKEVVWTDNRHRGYVRLVLTRDQATADVITVSHVDQADYAQRTLKTLRIAKAGQSLQYV